MSGGFLCPTTGLYLVGGRRNGLRVATESWGPLNPPERVAGDDPVGWNRYDTPGSTVYLADTPEIAYSEVLSPFALKLGQVHPLQKDADFFGMALEEYLGQMQSEWNAMVPGCLPAHWRHRRRLYNTTLQGTGWWIDIEHPESLAVIGRGIGNRLRNEAGIERMTLGVLLGEQRFITTLIGQWIRGLKLHDGSAALGIRFHSKHGGGYCWAYWLRRKDDGLPGDPLSADAGQDIDMDDPALQAVARRFRIQMM